MPTNIIITRQQEQHLELAGNQAQLAMVVAQAALKQQAAECWAAITSEVCV